jgi:hypothetical protein
LIKEIVKQLGQLPCAEEESWEKQARDLLEVVDEHRRREALIVIVEVNSEENARDTKQLVLVYATVDPAFA